MRRKKEESAPIAIIGVGRFGRALAETLAHNGYQIIVTDKDPEKVRMVRDLTPYAYVVEHLTKESLDEIGVRNCDIAVVCIGSSIDTNILATLHLLNLGVPRVISKATSKEMGQILEKLGAEVVYPEHDMGVRIAKRIMSHHLVDYFSLKDDIEIYELRIPERLIGKTIAQADLRARFGINIIAVEKGRQTITDVSPDYTLQKDDALVVIGRKDHIEKFENDYDVN